MTESDDHTGHQGMCGLAECTTAHERDLARAGDPAPARITTMTPEGWVITVIDRPPLAGERGWWVPELATPEEMFASVLDGAAGARTAEVFGFPVASDYDDEVDDDGLRPVTIVVENAPAKTTINVLLTRADLALILDGFGGEHANTATARKLLAASDALAKVSR